MSKTVRGFSFDDETLLMVEVLSKKLGIENKSAVIRAAIREKYYKVFGNLPPDRVVREE